MAKWQIDSVHSNVGFWVRHLMVTKVHGTFTKFSGSFEFDEKNPAAASVDVTIDAASVDTKEPQRDGHLKSPDFFDVEKFPHITFEGKGAEGSGTDFTLTGDLTMHGVTKPVKLEIEYAGTTKHPQVGDIRSGFSAKTSISRKEFGMIFNQVLDTGGFALSDKVEITLEIQASKVD